MVIRLDPRWPLVWRDPLTVQFGIDPPRLVLSTLTPHEERMLAALSVGVTHDGLAMIAGGRLTDRDDLLNQLAPVLQRPAKTSGRATIALSGGGKLGELLEHMLGEHGYRVVAAPDAAHLVDSSPDIAIAVNHWILPPQLHTLWLRRDVPHIPVIFTDSAVHLGPIVEPGSGPCLLCVELHRRDDDVAWPAIATQLLSRSPGPESPVLIAEASAALFRIIVDRLESGTAFERSLRISRAGERSTHEWFVHPECGCRGIDKPITSATTPWSGREIAR